MCTQSVLHLPDKLPLLCSAEVATVDDVHPSRQSLSVSILARQYIGIKIKCSLDMIGLLVWVRQRHKLFCITPDYSFEAHLVDDEPGGRASNSGLLDYWALDLRRVRYSRRQRLAFLRIIEMVLRLGKVKRFYH